MSARALPILSVVFLLVPWTLVSAGEIHEAIIDGRIDRAAELIGADPDLIHVPDETDASNSLPLHLAAYHGHVEIARLLLDAGADIERGDNDQTPPLCVAAMNHHGDVVDLLLERGADVNRRDRNGGYSLSFAAWAADTQIVRRLLDAGADLNYFSNEGFTLLQVAARKGLTDLLALLLKTDHDVNIGDLWGVTPLHWAVASNDTAMMRSLFEHGADPSPASTSGETPLWKAMFGGNKDVIRLLLDSGADTEAQVGSGWTPLFAASYLGKGDLVTLLLDYGAAADLQDGRGVTALMQATGEGQAEAVEALLAGGVDPDVSTEDGQTALLMAASAGNPGISRLLARHGADVNLADKAGLTPLSQAVRTGDDATVGVLLAAGTRVDMADNHGRRTALHWAAIHGYPDVAERLLNGGASINEKDASGMRPLDLAVRYGHPDVAEVLKERGAKGKTLDREPCGLSSVRNLESKEAVMWYLGHSGWAVKTRNHLLVFDYWSEGRAPPMPGLCSGRIRPEEIAAENVAVFITHEHTDHFDPVILDWRETVPRLTYIFGFEPEGDFPRDVVGPRGERTIGGIKITTIESNDSGVGFLVEVDGLVIFHAGDHANRKQDFSGPFKEEIDFLVAGGIVPDIALMPILGCGFGDIEAVRKGVHYTLEVLTPRVFVPMHCGGVEHLSCEFIEDCRDRFRATKMAAPENRGDRFRYRGGKIEKL